MNQSNISFNGRRLLIATKHQKETVMAPILEKALNVKCITIQNLDTDVLGTFTGEIEREDNPICTAKKKCQLGLQMIDCDMAIASEGSFGSHPNIFFAPADDEIVFFWDKKNDLEVMARELSLETNFSGSNVQSEEELIHFAKRVKFPSHALIIKSGADNFTEIEKGIKNRKKLIATFRYFMNKYGAAYVETDMRAMYNPSRLKVIEKATKKLVAKLLSVCPQCNTPGFSVTEAKTGLPCSWCNSPTRSTISYISTCPKCLYSKEDMYPNGITKEEPTYCDFCNP